MCTLGAALSIAGVLSPTIWPIPSCQVLAGLNEV
jgi:hypothetical protein